MNAPLLPNIFTRLPVYPDADLPSATECTSSYLWESRFGTILIEVRHGKAYVNGQVVEPAEPGPSRECGATGSGIPP